MSRNSRLGLASLLTLAGTSALQAAPCKDKPLGLTDPTIKVSVYEDCQDPNVAYVVPQDLNIQAASFSGEKSFLFTTTSTGEARVAMKLNLLVDNQRLARTMDDLRRGYKRRFRFLPFEIQNVKLDGFSVDDGVKTQRIVASASDSSAYFSIGLGLTADGAALWKQSAEDDFYTFQGAALSYQIKFSDSSGAIQWIDSAQSIFMDSLPSCEILSNCTTEERSSRLLKKGREFGRFYFRTQYLQCGDFLDTPFFEPGLDLIEDSFLTSSERETVHLAAVEGFNSEKTTTEKACSMVNDKDQGRRWFTNFQTDQHIICANLTLWPFTRISTYLATASENFKAGARESYNSFVASCPALSPKAACDERQGETCGGILTDNTKMCVSAEDVARLKPKNEMNCSFLVYERFFGSDYALVSKFTKVPAVTAQIQGICASIKAQSRSRSDYKTIISCE